MRPMTDAEIARADAAIEAVIAGKSRPPSRAPADPYDIRESEADQVRGLDKDPARWRAAMEHFGFRWLEPHQVNEQVGLQIIRGPGGSEYMRFHDEGQWRAERHRMAFTLKELCANFRTPENFAHWMEDQVLRRRAAAAGIVLARR